MTRDVCARNRASRSEALKPLVYPVADIMPFLRRTWLSLLHSYDAKLPSARSRRGNISGEAGRTAPEDTWLTVAVHCDTTFRIRLCGPT